MSLSHQTHQPPSFWLDIYFIKDLTEIAILLSNEEIHAKKRERVGVRGVNTFFILSPTWQKSIHEKFISRRFCVNCLAWIMGAKMLSMIAFVCLQTSLLLNFYVREQHSEGGILQHWLIIETLPQKKEKRRIEISLIPIGGRKVEYQNFIRRCLQYHEYK